MSTEQTIGELKGRVAILEDEVRGLREDVRELLAILNAGKGTWRTLVAIGAVATALGAGIATVISWFR
jgi:hypothetical protein